MFVYRVIKKVCVPLMIFLWGAMKNLVYSNIPHTIDDLKMAISGVPWNFFGWVQQIQLRTVGRVNGDLGAVAP
jgi:hypothetical protein